MKVWQPQDVSPMPKILSMKGSFSQQSSPTTSSSSSSLASQGTRELSDGTDHSPSCEESSRLLSSSGSRTTCSSSGSGTSSSSATRGKDMLMPDGGLHKTSGSRCSQDLTAIVDSTASKQQQTVFLTSHNECSSPTYSGLELNPIAVRPLILHHPHMVEGVEPVGDEGSMSWLYDFYPNVLGTSPKDELESYVEQSSGGSAGSGTCQLEQQQQQQQQQQLEEHQHQRTDFDPRLTIFRSQEKYVVTLSAPISIAQRKNEDTLTYLNKGQFYSICVSANTCVPLPLRAMTVLALTFFDESDSRMELHHWQYWHNLQANPNQKAFDIDRKNCESILGKLEDLAYNAASFIWCPEVGAKIVFRINCLSTEFSSQKGVKGIPLYLVTDTYEDVCSEGADPVHRGFCRIKIFRDKGAERKNKDETRSVERRVQKFMKRQPGGSQESEPTMFHPPSKETTFTSADTLGPKLFLFTPQPHTCPPEDAKDHSLATVDPLPESSPPSNFLANIKDRVNKRSFTKALKQTKEEFCALEVEEGEDTPPKKTPRIPNHSMTTVYVRKKEEKVYNALMLDSLTILDFKLQVARKYDIPTHMIKDVFKRTKKDLLVHFDDDMISRFQDEDDFIIDFTFNNQKGYFDLFIHY